MSSKVALDRRWIVSPLLVGGALAIVAASPAQQTVTYTYDAVGRLVRAQTTTAFSNVDARYEHDKANNRSRVVVTTNGPTVPNGDFETPALAAQSFAYRPDAPWLTFSGNAGLAANGSAWGFPTPWHGNQVAMIQSSGGMVSWVELKAIQLVVGKRYVFGFAASRRPGYPENNLRISINGTLVWDGPPATQSGFTPNPTQSFVAQATTAMIRFEATPTPYDSSSAIDAISIQQID